MTVFRPVLVAVVGCTVAVSACTGPDDGSSTGATSSSTLPAQPDAGEGTSSTPDAGSSTGDAAPSTGDAGTSTGDAGASTTGGPASTGTVTAAPEGAGVVSLEEAQESTARLLSRAAEQQRVEPEDAERLAAEAFRGPELVANQAAMTLRPVEEEPSADYDTAEPNVLAVSRDDGQSPWAILVQTVPPSRVPELHLLTSEEQGADWRITWTATMLPGTSLGAFDRRSEGSPMLREGQGELAQDPHATLGELADYVAYSGPTTDQLPDLDTNGYAPEVRAQAAAQAAEVEAQATFAQTHELAPGTMVTLQLDDGSALTFAVRDRTSTFDVRAGMELIPPEPFTLLDGESSITESATLGSLVFVALHIPAEEGTPQLVAVREQLVEASGS